MNKIKSRWLQRIKSMVLYAHRPWQRLIASQEEVGNRIQFFVSRLMSGNHDRNIKAPKHRIQCEQAVGSRTIDPRFAGLQTILLGEWNAKEHGMSNQKLLLRIFSAVCLILIWGKGAHATTSTFTWKEEVLLHDGSRIIVERTVERGGRHEIGQKPPYKEQSLVFTMPGPDQQVTWEDKFGKDLGSANFLPMLLDIRKDVAYLVVSPMGCASYNKWGRPNPPYVIFKYDGKMWQRIPLQELPAEIKVPNLIFSSPDIAVEKSGTRFIS